MAYDRMALWIDDVEIEKRRYRVYGSESISLPRSGRTPDTTRQTGPCQGDGEYLFSQLVVVRLVAELVPLSESGLLRSHVESRAKLA